MISKNVEPIFHTSVLGLIFNHELLPAPLVILHLEYTTYTHFSKHITTYMLK